MKLYRDDHNNIYKVLCIINYFVILQHISENTATHYFLPNLLLTHSYLSPTDY